jgi:DNA-binding transcriptional MerR regulator
MAPQAPRSKDVTAKDLAVRAGLPYSTIDHWSGLDLLPFTRVGNRRYYDKDLCLKICARIRELQNEDMNLRGMRSLLRNEFPNLRKSS